MSVLNKIKPLIVIFIVIAIIFLFHINSFRVDNFLNIEMFQDDTEVESFANTDALSCKEITCETCTNYEKDVRGYLAHRNNPKPHPSDCDYLSTI